MPVSKSGFFRYLMFCSYGAFGKDAQPGLVLLYRSGLNLEKNLSVRGPAVNGAISKVLSCGVLAARFSFSHFLFTCETSLLLSYLVCKSSRATSSARGALRFGMAVWCLPFSDLGHTFHCIGTAPYRDGARVATRVFETGQKASDQTFANGRPEACCEGISLYLHTLSTGSSLDKETSTIIPQWKGLSRAKDGALDFFSSNPEPTSQLYR